MSERSFMARIRDMGQAPNGALWLIFLIVAGSTVALSWEWSEVAWPGVIVSAVLLVLIVAWSRARGWPLFPW